LKKGDLFMPTTETLEVKSKGQVVGAFEYTAPENMKEAIEMDGKDRIFALYLTRRKADAMTKERTRLTGGGGVSREISKALKGLKPDKLAEVAKLLGVEL
jgi:hypothetical protein